MSREELEKRALEARYNLVSSKDKETIDILEELAIKALEQEPRKDEVILTKEEYGELVSSEFDNGYAKGYREALEQEPIEVEATKLQMTYNQGFEDCRKAVMDLLSEAGKLSLLAMVADLASVNPQEPKTGHWIGIDEEPHEDYECDKCGYVVSTFTANIEPHTEYKYCPNCGARMESEVQNESID